MKKTLFTVFACVLACSAGATHFHPLTDKAVKRLAHDETHLYILHYDGLEVFDKNTGESVCYTQETGHIPEGSSPGLNALAVHGDTVWVGGGNGFLTAIVGAEAKSWAFKYDMSNIFPEEENPPKCPFDFNSIVYDSKGRMYVGGFDQVGYLVKPGKASLAWLPDMAHYGAEVWQMLVDKDDAVWVSYTSDSGGNSLVKYTAGEEEVEEVSSKLGLGKRVKAMAFDKDGNLWLGTCYDPKLYRYDGETLEEHEIKKIASGWMYSGICCMAFDDEGRLWLLQSNAQKLGYEHYSAGPLCCLSGGEMTEYPLPADMGFAYCLDVDGGDVYVGTDKGVLQLIDGKMTPLNTPWYSDAPPHNQDDGEKCATPTIAYDNGKLLFSCETAGAECVYEIKCADSGSGRGGEVSLGQSYEIRVHATLDGWQDSDVATATIGWRNGRPIMEGFSSVTMDGTDGIGDVNGDGQVDVADIARIITIMAEQASE